MGSKSELRGQAYFTIIKSFPDSLFLSIEGIGSGSIYALYYAWCSDFSAGICPSNFDAVSKAFTPWKSIMRKICKLIMMHSPSVNPIITMRAAPVRRSLSGSTIFVRVWLMPLRMCGLKRPKCQAKNEITAACCGNWINGKNKYYRFLKTAASLPQERHCQSLATSLTNGAQ